MNQLIARLSQHVKVSISDNVFGDGTPRLIYEVNYGGDWTIASSSSACEAWLRDCDDGLADGYEEAKQ